MKTLNLSLKRQWFDLTKAGIKMEDYREINDYWIKRLVSVNSDADNIMEALCGLRDGYTSEQVYDYYGVYLKEFTHNRMTLGYPKSADKKRVIYTEHKGIEIRMGNPEWGADYKKIYFVIKHGSVQNVPTVKGMTLEQWIKQETKRRTAYLWGDPTTFKPVLCSTVLGDGQQLAYLGTIGQRPYYWLILIDSATDMNADDFDFEDLLQPLEDEFGKQDEWMTKKEFDQMKDEPENDWDNYNDWFKYKYAYPCIGWDGGHYGTIVNMKTGYFNI